MNLIFYNTIAVLIGIILDLIIGDPHGWPHIVRFYGLLLKILEKIFYPIKDKQVGGGLYTGFMLIIVICINAAILVASYRYNIYLYMAIEAIICWQCLAIKSLQVETKYVYNDLVKDDLPAARKSVSMVVGRDTENLTVEGVTKAAVETVAENTADGVAAPLFYIMLGGGFLGALYKAINTMDSTVGYKNDRYMNFGTCSAKLDDLANFIPARLCGIVMVTAAFLLNMDGDNAWKIFKRDRYNHASPNSAQTEAVMAGALDVQLAGDAYYFGKLHKKPFIGDDIRKVEPEDIIRSHKLLNCTAMLLILVMLIVRIIAYAAL